jgi:pSer/pThr/pTyr-binding forkhead associated (FHA) protein
MTQACPVAEAPIEFPASAPQIRVTAGVGSAGQKTWNLRRPVTLLGSKRPAHIVLHDRGVSVAHCAIINTGSDVLLFDLHTTGGTFRGKERVDLVALQDGDVITLGETTIHVAIRQPTADADDSGAGIEYVDPTLMVSPLKISLIHTDSHWTVERAVTLIGRLDSATIRLDHADVSTRHGLLFRFGKQPAVFDLGGRAGIWVNGQKRDLSTLSDGDRVTVGPFGLQFQVQEATNGGNTTPAPAGATATSMDGAGAPSSPGAPQAVSTNNGTPEPSAFASAQGNGATASAVNTAEPAPSEPRTDPLQHNIAEAWERLNQWRAQLRSDAAAITQQQTTLSARESQLEARDAALRGQLHDITRFNEQLAERETELARYAAEVQERADAFGSIQKDFLDRQAEVQRKEEELHRREQAMNQRWSRMQSTTCPHCRKPISLGGG